MIYTVTFNPSIDYLASTDVFELGKTNRTNKEIMFPGGKGINVSIMLRNLGVKSVALGFVAGFIGDAIKSLLYDRGISTDFIELKEGCSRINVKIKIENSEQYATGTKSAVKETELNGMGPEITPIALESLYDKLDNLQSGDLLVLSGSVPKTVDNGIYGELTRLAKERGAEVIVDASGELLLKCLKYNPLMVKPNIDELGDLFGITIKKREEIVEYASKLKNMGARNVIVSLGGDGAIMIKEDGEVIEGEAPSGKVINSVGAGDSMVAGFIKGYFDEYKMTLCDTMLKADKYSEAFYMGLCAGSASAFSMEFATEETVLNVMNDYFSKQEERNGRI